LLAFTIPLAAAIQCFPFDLCTRQLTGHLGNEMSWRSGFDQSGKQVSHTALRSKAASIYRTRFRQSQTQPEKM
jgi:hypothetical protein